MGTCGSKCCFASPTPSISDPESPHEKAIISSGSLTTPPPPPKDPFSESPKNLSKFQIHPCPLTPSSSSATPSSSSNSSTTITSNTSTSYSSSYSTRNSLNSQANHSNLNRPPPMKKKFSSEFLSSCVENSNIVILDPTKKPSEPQILEIPITPSQYRSITTWGPNPSSLRQHTNTNTSMRISQSNHGKRARSVSPASRAGRKIIKPDPGSANPVNPNVTRPRTGDLPLIQWRSINSQRGSLNALTGPVSRPGNASKRDLKRPTMGKEANLAQVGDAKERQIEDGEVVCKERAKTPPLVEDLNNPLIAMDCFIFL